MMHHNNHHTNSRFRALRGTAGLVVIVLLLSAVPVAAGPPPSFRLKDLDGEWFSLDDHLGDKVLYISFWATWCVPCRRELPHLQKMYDELGERGFLVISINTDPPATRSKIKPFIRRYKAGFPCLLDPDNNVHDKYNPTRELPYAVLVDQRGEIHTVFPGYRSGDETLLREQVLALLEAASEEVTETADQAAEAARQ
jgi:peroxiredoxin